MSINIYSLDHNSKCAVWPRRAGGPTSFKPQAASLTACPIDDRIRIMTTINYKGKKMKLPFEIKTHSTEMTTRTNPFSGESIQLPAFAASVYDYTIHKNMEMETVDQLTNQKPGFSDNQDDWQLVRNGLDWFRQYFAKEYMVLLD